MPRFKTLFCAAVAALSASAAVAAPWGPPQLRDLILGFQAESGEGTGDNLFYNLGPATAIRDTPNAGVVVNLSAPLEDVYGADWYDRADLWFGAFNIRSNQTTGTADGDPNPTAYFTKASPTNTRAGADLFRFETAFNPNSVTNNLTTAWNPFSGLRSALITLTPNVDGWARMNSVANNVAWNNRWSLYNPFVSGAAAGTQAAAFSVFANGIQNNFGKAGQPAVRLDLQRYERGVTTGATYVATIEIAPNGNVSIVNTQVTSYNLNFSVSPSGSGSVSGATNGQSFTSGNSANLTATANAGYRFTGWSGDASGSSNPLSVLMNGNKSVVANFVQTFPLTLSATTNGTITVSGGLQTPYASGSTVQLIATPANGYKLTGWTGDGSGSTTPLIITMDAAKTVGATFEPDFSDDDNDGISKFTEVQLGTDPDGANTVDDLPEGFTFRGTTPALAGAEISAFDPGTDRLFVTSDAGLQVVDLSNPASPSLITTINLTLAPYSAVSNDVSSVAIANGVVAASVLNPDKEQTGHVVFLNASDYSHRSTENVGYHPDMVVFTPDGTKLLVANEGEYIAGGPGNTPGSISIINLVPTTTVTPVGFNAFDAAALKAQTPPVRIFGSEFAENDLEPEYIAISPNGSKAMITLQENNAVAILDIPSSTITNVVGLGTKDFSALLADFSDEDDGSDGRMGVLRTGLPVFGLYQPDAIASFTQGENTYYVVANEGDDRNDFLNPDETAALSTRDLDDTLFPNEADLKADSVLGRLKVSTYQENGDSFGSTVDQILAYGGRSFSILNASGEVVYDSGDLIETEIMSYGTPTFDDSRSDDKGPEPEGIAVSTLFGRTVAFVGLERSHGVMMFDITDALTDPESVSVVAFLRNTGATRPEGIIVIPAADSPNLKTLVVVSNETSRTVSVFEIENRYNLTVTTPSNGSITVQDGLNNPYLNGTQVQLTAEPANSGFVFTGWTVNGQPAGISNTLNVVMDADKTVAATFTAQYTVTVNVPSVGGLVGGTVTGLASGGRYLDGSNAVLTATPNNGYKFNGWTVTGPGANPGPSDNASLSFPVNGNKTVTATFAQNNELGKSVFTIFQEARLGALASRWEVGDRVDLDLFFFYNNLSSGFSINVVGLPPGLKWEVTRNSSKVVTGAKIVGTIDGEMTASALEIRMLNARGAIQGLPLVWNFKVAPYRLTGRYEVLLENAGVPVGRSFLNVTGPRAYTATLVLQGQASRSAAKGALPDITGQAPYDVLVRFPAGRAGVSETFVKFTINPASDIVTGSAGATNAATGIGNARGFRLHRAGREPRFPITVAFENAVDGNRTATPPTPGGHGYATGVLNPATNLIQLTGALGDAQRLTLGLNLSQTGQAVVFVQPYTGGAHQAGSYFGGILNFGDLGQPSRGGQSVGSEAPGLKWRKAANVSTDKSYKGGFGPLGVNARADRWVSTLSAEGMALSLGLTDRELFADYEDDNRPDSSVVGGGRDLPTIFSLRNGFNLVRVAPANSVVSSGRAVAATGAFSGNMTLNRPVPVSPFNGVLLQDGSGELVGLGLIQIFNSTTREFETAAIRLFNEVPNPPVVP